MKKQISPERLKEHLEWEEQFKKENPEGYNQYKKNHPETPNEAYQKAEELFATLNERYPNLNHTI